MLGRITRTRRGIAYASAVLMVTNVVVAGTVADAALAEEPAWQRDDLRTDDPVPVTPVQPGGSLFTGMSADEAWDSGRVAAALPDPGAATFSLGGAALTASVTEAVPEGFPVSVTARVSSSAVPYAAVSGLVTVEIADQQTTRSAGVDGLLVTVSGQAAGPASLEADYGGFAGLFGGGWASRLEWFELPACAVTTPQEPGCLAVAPLASVNDIGEQAVSTSLQLDQQVEEDAAGTQSLSAGSGSTDVRVFALMASSASDGAGDYRATDLSPAGSWAAGGNDGAFSYAYPLRLPPGAGPVPGVSLGYSSASHDGRTSGRNSQASWVGDGWGYDPGFVERSYKPCSLDDDGSPNNPQVTGDLCWDGDGANVTISLNGTNSTLVLDDATGVWRAASDPNWRIELLGSPASNSNGSTSERWKVTTSDGTQYFFASEVSSSSSRWTVPVFGNHSGEPCRSSAFDDSWCRQAYRWMLDKVVDVHGNMVRYFYATTSGHYGAAGDVDNRLAYHREGRLVRIEYGLRADDANVPATGRVLFSTGMRCLEDCGSTSNPNEENWADTPWDLHCDAAPCTGQLSPTFFSTHRLTSVTTQVRNSSGSGFRTVDSWSLEHEFLDYGDDEQVTLWLKSLQHTGHVGSTSTLPKVEFTGEALPNRVNAAAGVPVMWRWRLSSIKTETGAVITVTYAEPECSPSNLPSNAHTNSMRCYPVRWTPEFHTQPIEDWFHKHVVTSVVETDTTGGSVAVETYYEYATSGGGTSVLWAFDDSEFTEDEHRTYGMWRGYAQVTTRVGDPAGQQTRTRSRFYRGLDGQPLPNGGTRSVNLTDSESNTVVDHEALSGQVWETLTYNGSTVISGTTYQYWTRKTATRQRDHAGGSVDAWLTGLSVEKSRQRLTGSTWRRTETRTTFDNQGRVIRVNSLGDIAKAGDEYCTRTEYADNNSAWIKNAVSRMEVVSVDCDSTASRPGDVVSEVLTFFDNSSVHGSTPSKGMPTRVDTLDDWDAGPVYVTTAEMGYDQLGRVVETTNALDHTSTVTFTPAGPGPVTQTVATNPLGHEVTTILEPAWGKATREVEPNGRRADMEYDPLGRLTGVWLPGRNSATQSPSRKFEYLVRDDGPSAVTSMTLNHLQDYVVEVVLYDAFLRPRQVQAETADGGRLLTETVYDSLGRVEEEYGPNYNLAAPGTSIVRVTEGDSRARVEYLFDGAGRLTDEVFYHGHVEQWRTTTTYGGSTAGFLVAVQPPDGAPATATITDARGQVVEKRTYLSHTPTGAYHSLVYEYTPTGQMEKLTDEAGNEWSWEYDLRGQEVASHDPDAGTTTMGYDVAGQLVSTTDARGEVVTREYDPLGRQVARRDGTGQLLAEWEYDTAINGKGMLGRAIRWHDGEAYIEETRAVNPQGLVSQQRVILPASQGPLAGSYWFTRSYTWNGLPAFEGFTDAGDAEGGGLQWTYDHVGNPTSLVFTGDYTGVTVIVDDATFTPYNEILTRTLGASYARQAWHGFVYEEDTRRLERATFDRQATVPTVADLRYTYDDVGNVLSVADVPADLPGNHELQCFQYDGLRRLVESWAQGDTSECAAGPSGGVLGGPAPYWHSYDHDVTGNRTQEVLRAPGQTAVTRSYAYPGAGQPQPHTLQQVTATGGGDQASFAYDQAGNTTSRTMNASTQTLTWNTEGQVEQVDENGQDPVTMIYTAGGDRLIRDDGDTVTAFLPQTEVTWDRTTNTVDGTRYFTHAGHVVAICTGQDVADWTFLGVDHHGSTTTHAVNAFTGVEQIRRMDPYGNPRGPAPHNWPGQQGFVGGVEDPTGLVHIGARSYDPPTGRFLSADPIMVTTDDQQINGYAYAHNNPISFSDPTGLLVDGLSCIDGDCSYHNPDHSVKTREQCRATGGCGPNHKTHNHVLPGAGGGPPAPSAPLTPEELEWIDGSVTIYGDLIIVAPSPAELDAAFSQAHKNYCGLSLPWFCDPDSWLTDQVHYEYGVAYALCAMHPEWCGWDPDMLPLNVDAPEYGGFGRLAGTAARNGVKGLLKDASLPSRGGFRYIPPRRLDGGQLPRVPMGGNRVGYRDRFGNVWVRGTTRTQGDNFEWDVQLRNQISWRMPDGTVRRMNHMNISPDGRITHVNLNG